MPFSLVRGLERKEIMASNPELGGLRLKVLGLAREREASAKTLAFTVKRRVIGPINARRRGRIIEEGLATPILIEEIEVRTVIKALGVVQRLIAHHKHGRRWIKHLQ